MQANFGIEQSVFQGIPLSNKSNYFTTNQYTYPVNFKSNYPNQSLQMHYNYSNPQSIILFKEQRNQRLLSHSSNQYYSMNQPTNYPLNQQFPLNLNKPDNNIPKPPDISSDQYIHFNYLNYLTNNNNVPKDANPQLIWYLFELLQQQIWPVKTLLIISKIIEHLSVRQLVFLRSLICKCYPSRQDYLVQGQKIKEIDALQFSSYFTLLRLLPQFSFDFEDYLHRMVNLAEIIASQCKNITPKEGKQYLNFENKKLQIQLKQVLDCLSEKLNNFIIQQENIMKEQANQISFEVLLIKIGRLYFQIMILPEEIIEIINKQSVFVLQYFVNKNRKSNYNKQYMFFKEVIEKNMIYALKICAKRVNKLYKQNKIKNNQSNSKIIPDQIQQLNDEYCLIVLRILQFKSWTKYEFILIQKFISDCSFITCCDNLQALKFCKEISKKQINKSVLSSIKDKQLISKLEDENW